MKRIINNFRKIYLQRIFAFIILEMFILTYVPMGAGAYPVDKKPNTNNNHYHGNISMYQIVKNWVYKKVFAGHIKDDEMPLLATYYIDKKTKAIVLSWNRDKIQPSTGKHSKWDTGDSDPGRRFYIFKKHGLDDEYQLACNED